MNGINYRIAVVVKDREEWKFAQFSDAPVDQIVFLNKGFNTNDEKKASKMLKERRNGKVFNRKGDLIEDIGVKAEQLDKEEKLRSKNTQAINNLGILSTADHVRPSSIRVYMSKSQNQINIVVTVLVYHQ
ncbi:hypothetical protein [Paenibacillus sp. HGH0039]|nr:hypothetical protein [Paenibacillus sp. HGH0039]